MYNLKFMHLKWTLYLRIYSSIRVYLSERHGAPVLIWPVPSPTTRSAIKQSSVSPDRWDTMVPQPVKEKNISEPTI